MTRLAIIMSAEVPEESEAFQAVMKTMLDRLREQICIELAEHRPLVIATFEPSDIDLVDLIAARLAERYAQAEFNNHNTGSTNEDP